MLDITVRAVGIFGLLLAFSEHLGPEKVRRLEQTVREHFSVAKLLRLPFGMFRGSADLLVRSEAFGAWLCVLGFVFFMRADIFGDLRDYYVFVMMESFAPVRWLEGHIGVLGVFVGAWIGVFLALLFAVVVPGGIMLILVSLVISLAVYAMLGLLWVSDRAKTAFRLSGSMIKLTGWVVSLVAFVLSW